MSNFKITFSNPWLLFLLIPAVLLTLYPYFRVAKRYRRNRNRVVSVVLHLLIMLLSITLLCGIMFLYDVPNKENEIILLIDSSYSNSETVNEKEDFIQDVIEECGANYKLGIVKFGYDQVYAAPLSNDARSAYAAYVQSDDPDTTATDFTSALKYASELFNNPQAGKIVVLSDGIETDGNAISLIKSITADGIKVDVVHFPNPSEDNNEVQVVSVEMPNYNIDPGKPFKIGLTLQHNYNKDSKKMVAVSVTDTYENGANFETEERAYVLTLTDAVQTFDLDFVVPVSGMHTFCFEVLENDNVIENNGYYSYINILDFKDILIIEKYKGESDKLKAYLDEEYNVTVFSVERELDLIPQDIDELCNYQQVILVNISNADMTEIAGGVPDQFALLLRDYVNNRGGGLFTVGGQNDISNGKITPHAYNRNDMYDSEYQKLLPVQVVDYTPPVAVMIIIDHSGSMGTGDDSAVGLAKLGAQSCVDALNGWDWCGIMTLDNGTEDILTMTRANNKSVLYDAIAKITTDGEGGTIFSNTLLSAGNALGSVDVVRKHIIMVTDGQPSDEEEFVKAVEANAAKGITMSVVAYQCEGVYLDLMKDACAKSGGTCYDVKDRSQIGASMRQDVAMGTIGEIEYGEPFTPTIKDTSPVLSGIETAIFPQLTGYYGTQEKNDPAVKVPLIGNYTVPIFAQWKLSENSGTVASFMCDLNGEWSGDFLTNEVGRRFLSNVIESLFPVKEIKKPEINVLLREDNYTNQLNLDVTLEEGDKVEVTVKALTEEAAEYYSVNEMPITAYEQYSRFTVIITQPGIYAIYVTKTDASGTPLASTVIYKAFSYSYEYNAFPQKDPIGEEFLASLAQNGNGVVAVDAFDIFDSFVKLLHKDFDPRLLFLILIIVMFLLDVAVRKFKFKWPHEIVRDYKEKKKLQEHEKR